MIAIVIFRLTTTIQISFPGHNGGRLAAGHARVTPAGGDRGADAHPVRIWPGPVTNVLLLTTLLGLEAADSSRSQG